MGILGFGKKENAQDKTANGVKAAATNVVDPKQGGAKPVLPVTPVVKAPVVNKGNTTPPTTIPLEDVLAPADLEVDFFLFAD